MHNIWFFTTIGRLPFTKKALQIDITSQCNLHCKGCYHFSSATSKDMSDDELLSFLTKKARQGYRKLWLFGGEPSLRSNLFEAIDKLFLEIQVISNGTIKIDPKFRWKLWISMDGPKEINDPIRGVGTFDKICRNYRGDQRVGLVMTVNRTNYQHIPDMVELVKGLGVRTASFTFYSRCENRVEEEFDFSPEDLGKIEALLTTEMAKNGKYLLIDSATLKSILYGKINHPRWDGRCYFAKVLMDSFDSSGQSRKCCIANVICDSCRILPPHQYHALMVTRQAPWRKYAFK